MGNIKLYNGNVVKLIMNMNDENMNLRVLAKKCGMDWLVCRQILNTLYIHNIIDIQNKKQILYFNLTNEGKEVNPCGQVIRITDLNISRQEMPSKRNKD